MVSSPPGLAGSGVRRPAGLASRRARGPGGDDQTGGRPGAAPNLGVLLITALTTSVTSGLATNPAVSRELGSAASVELSSGVPFVSDAQLRTVLEDAGVDDATADAIVDENASARLDALRAALAVLALATAVAVFAARRLPAAPTGGG
jgi:hypothetical protein